VNSFLMMVVLDIGVFAFPQKHDEIEFRQTSANHEGATMSALSDNDSL
jgi:hypothetical protein